MSSYVFQTKSRIPVTIDVNHNSPGDGDAAAAYADGVLVYQGPLEHDHEVQFTVSRRGIVRLWGSGPLLEVEIFGDGKVTINRDGSFTLADGMKQC
ncbi:MAG: hypothetical protein KDD66_08940 [Bdellovibrionales bacterium]|nr:hypothetical protein [Bdellovibrionales bacterium]